MPVSIYKSYSFVDKDPIIDYLRTIMDKSDYSVWRLSNESGVSVATINNWLYGATKRPQAASLNAVLRALDYKLDITSVNQAMGIIPTPYVPKHNDVPEAIKPKRLGAAKYVKVRHIKRRG